MDYTALRQFADGLIDEFSNKQEAILLKGEKTVDHITGKIKKTFREVSADSRAVMISYNEETIAQSDGVLKAGDVKFIARFTEEPTEVEDRIRYANVEYNIVHFRPIDPTGGYVVTYIIQGRKA